MARSRKSKTTGPTAESTAGPPASPRRRHGLWLLWSLVLAVSLSAAGLYLWNTFQRFSDQPLHDREAAVVVTLDPGQRLDDVLDQLEAAGVAVGPRWQWQLLLRQSGLASRLQTGEYAVHRRLTPRGLLAAIAAGKVVQHRITVFDGITFKDLREELARHPALTQTLTGLSDAEVLTRIGSTRNHAEGLFLPETYFFPRGFSDLDLLKRAYWDLEKTLAQAWEQRQPDLPLADPYEALILASIIEKETGKASERPIISGVFIRRLRLGMRLQTDPTVIYGMGASFDGNLRRTDLRTDTPWNTYTRHGLPPTPIALASRAAILAAVQPAPGDALYFVSRGDGSHEFSATLNAHNRAVARYQLKQR